MKMKYYLSCSCGNDSVAMIQLMHEKGLSQDCQVVYIDTGFSISWWPERVSLVRQLARSYGMTFEHIRGETFGELIRRRKGFPMPGKTWCSYHLKAVPFLAWADIHDPSEEGIILIGKRRDESPARKDTPEYIEDSPRHGGRTVWHPLAFTPVQERDLLVGRAGIPILPFRSQECAPCVNANRKDFLALGELEIERVQKLESTVQQNMFRPWHHMGAKGIYEVIRWAKSPRGKYEPSHEGCDSGYCE